jgi:FMN phosphatase YigB (HAD superfamily)
VLSNGSPAMMKNCLDSSGLGEFFGPRVSVDEVRVFKPSSVLYRHTAGRLSRPIGQQPDLTVPALDRLPTALAR